MDPIVLVVAGAIAALVAPFLLRAYRTERSRALGRHRAVPRTDIGTTAEGPAKVAGTLELAGPPIHAPLSGRACAVYDVRVTEMQNERHRVIAEERFARDFLVNDGTGRAHVRPGATIELAIVEDGRFSSGLFDDAEPAFERFLAKHGERSKGILLNRTLRYHEGVFEPGERVVVYGRARREADPTGSAGASYRETATRLVIEPLDGTMVLSDEPEAADVPRRPG
jgi:hypothetical protein